MPRKIARTNRISFPMPLTTLIKSSDIGFLRVLRAFQELELRKFLIIRKHYDRVQPIESAV